MNGRRSFFSAVGLVLGLAIAAGAYPMSRWGSAEVLWAVAAGAALSTANVIAGYLMIEYGFQRSYTTFIKVVIGGMGVRLVVMLGVMLVLILVAHMRVMPLTVSVLGFYAVYLVLEVYFLQRMVDAQQQR